MNSVFSADDFSDPFWQSPPPPPPPATAPAMNRSESEWALEMLLQEVSGVSVSSSSASETHTAAPSVLSQSSTSSIPPENGEDEVVEITKHPIHHHHHHPNPNPHPQPLNRNLMVPTDSEEYRAFLKSKLDLACAAAVAMSRETNAVKPEVFSSLSEDQRLSARDMSLGTQAFHNGAGQGISMAQIRADGASLGIPSLPTAQGKSDGGSGIPALPATQRKSDGGSPGIPALPTTQRKSDGGSPGIPALPTTLRKQEVQARQTTSGSSREDSDDDDLEGDTGTNENMDPADVKRERRMQSNRESARRSRRRKQAQLNELETQVGQLRDERTSLLTHFTDVNQKCDDAAVDNRILKADIETLRAKITMAEEQVKRMTGLNPVLLARSSMPNPGMPFVGGQVDASTNVAVPMQTNPHQFFHQPVLGVTPAPPHLQRLNNNFPNSTLVPLATNPQTDNGNSNDGGITVMPSMQLTADGQSLPSMQQVQKQIGSNARPAGTLPTCDSRLPHVVAKDAKKK